jgi:hypothetical protein
VWSTLSTGKIFLRATPSVSMIQFAELSLAAPVSAS